MKKHLKWQSLQGMRGYNLIEVLVVSSIIAILVTIPIATMRKAKTKVHEVEAIGALNMMAVAFESYNNETRPHRYPNYLEDGNTSHELIDYQNAEAIWDDLVRKKFIPQRYSLYRHDSPDLLARGYRLSIYPFRTYPTFSTSPRYSYAIGMIPLEGSSQRRVIAIFQGYNDGVEHLSPRARKLPGSGTVRNAKFYTWKDF